MRENDVTKAAQPPREPRRGSTVEMVDRIKDQIETKEPPRGR
jgi:hypothetical protein